MYIYIYLFIFPKGVQPIFAEFWSDHHWTVLLHPFWRSKLTYLRPRTRSQLARKVGEGNEAPKALTHRLKVRDVFSGVSIIGISFTLQTITIPKTSSQTNSSPHEKWPEPQGWKGSFDPTIHGLQGDIPGYRHAGANFSQRRRHVVSVEMLRNSMQPVGPKNQLEVEGDIIYIYIFITPTRIRVKLTPVIHLQGYL